MMVAPNVLTEGKRQKEEEMIWRGKQYVRGIKLFYRKNGRFPQQLDDLTKPKQGSLRFMRQAYKDPMNKEDGSWRLIYIGPSGQLIGSLKPQKNIQMGGFPQIGTPAAALAGQNPSQPGMLGVAAGSTGAAMGATGTGVGAPGATAGGAATAGQPGTPGQPADAATDDQAQAAAAAADTPAIMGGNIIGVGGKINKRSLKIYTKAKNYRLFEFIWDPSKDVANALGGAPNATIPGVGAPGTSSPATNRQPNMQPGSGLGQPNPMPPTQINPPPNP